MLLEYLSIFFYSAFRHVSFQGSAGLFVTIWPVIVVVALAMTMKKLTGRGLMITTWLIALAIPILGYGTGGYAFHIVSMGIEERIRAVVQLAAVLIVPLSALLWIARSMRSGDQGIASSSTPLGFTSAGRLLWPIGILLVAWSNFAVLAWAVFGMTDALAYGSTDKVFVAEVGMTLATWAVIITPSAILGAFLEQFPAPVFRRVAVIIMTLPWIVQIPFTLMHAGAIKALTFGWRP
ncbi:hypothetical protein [Breoghania sp. L-A4]|uniref:hypothetical protein n=1 Tax=Breoghania sp. L-A4 TaxID=2304600 RepID=UPI0013C33E75|nr:hypothetical protein [Breoghania sp. L-A4]